VRRRSAKYLSSRLKGVLDQLDGQMARLGRFGSTAALTAMAVGAAVPLHFLIRTLEGLPIQRSRWSISPSRSPSSQRRSSSMPVM
jgi:hypothetical protein